jgi:hypothetical protein
MPRLHSYSPLGLPALQPYMAQIHTPNHGDTEGHTWIRIRVPHTAQAIVAQFLSLPLLMIILRQSGGDFAPTAVNRHMKGNRVLLHPVRFLQAQSKLPIHLHLSIRAENVAQHSWSLCD